MKTPHERVQWIEQKHQPLFERLVSEAKTLTEAPGPIQTRARRMIAIVDELAAKVAPHAACRSGCSHCCYQTVMISPWEAERIARASHRQVSQVVAWVPLSDDTKVARERYTGVPCPFLFAGRCTAYEVRPIACRTLYNLSDDPSLCDIDLHPGGDVPYFNFQSVIFPAAILLWNEGMQLADIRDYFPSNP